MKAVVHCGERFLVSNAIIIFVTGSSWMTNFFLHILPGRLTCKYKECVIRTSYTVMLLWVQQSKTHLVLMTSQH